MYIQIKNEWFVNVNFTSKQILTDCGFTYRNIEDIVGCFSSGLVLHGWKKKRTYHGLNTRDIIWNVYYDVLLSKGNHFVEYVKCIIQLQVACFSIITIARHWLLLNYINVPSKPRIILKKSDIPIYYHCTTVVQFFFLENCSCELFYIYI